MISIKNINDIPIQKVYHYELDAYRKACKYNLRTGIYEQPNGDEVKLEILGSEGQMTNIQLKLTNLSHPEYKPLVVPIDALDRGDWIIDKIINNLKIKVELWKH